MNSPNPTPSSPSTLQRLIQEADALYVQGQPRVAREKYTEALRQGTPSPVLHYRIACCAWAEGNVALAQASFEKALQLDPNYADAHEGLGQLHMEVGRPGPADFHSARALELAPHDVEAAVSRAFVLESDRKTQDAWGLIQNLLDRGQATGRLAVLFGRMAPQLKREAEALDVLGKLLAAKQFANAREERGMRFAAASLLDALGRYDEAFNQAQIANRLRGVRYDSSQVERNATAQIEYFTREKLANLPPATHGSDVPVFIVGMPRSGTSLVEQILASHPQVHGAGELLVLPRLVDAIPRLLATSPVGFPDCLNALTPERANELADYYLRPMLAMAPGAVHITDKLPLNFLYLGLIQILFPNARIIHCTRDPLDTCLSCYMTDFAVSNEFSFDLASCGHFYRQYDRLMAHWTQVLDIPILEAKYESLVADPDPQSRRLVEFLGLPWDDRCLRFHENKRFVATASNEQVRRPIYHSSVERWRKYDKHLGPLRAALG